MNLRELLEAEIRRTDQDQWAELIERDCKTWLRGCLDAGKPVYRGIKSTAPFIEKDIRQDRTAIQMSQKRHDGLHDLFQRHGFPATRKNSIFCTTRKDVAADWGEPYIVFVKDGWTGTVFENQKNNYAFYNLAHAHDMDEAELEFVDMAPAKITTSTDLAKAIDDKHFEMLITGKGYYAISPAYWKHMADLLGF